MQIQRWMQLAGLETWVDGVGNVHGHLASSLADAQTLVIGSHYDTVLDAGQYDGSLGILVGIAAAKALLLQANADQPWAPTRARCFLFSPALQGLRCRNNSLGGTTGQIALTPAMQMRH